MVFAQRTACILIAAGWALAASAGELQRRLDAAVPGSIIRVEPGTYDGPLLIDKPLTLIGQGLPTIDGGGVGNVMAIRASDVTVRGFTITNSGINLAEDNAGIHISGDNATISDNRIVDSLHGIYLKKVRGCRVEGNTIVGKSTLPPPVKPVSATIVASSPELCATSLNINQRGNGIHLWNSEDNVLLNNTITETRDGMYFSFTNQTEVRGNVISQVRYGLHYMYSDNNTFEDNVFTDNAAGAAIMYSKGLLIRGNEFTANRGFRAYGMLLNSVDNTRIENNQLTGNTVGIYLENSNGNSLLGNAIARNYIGIRLTASSDANVFSRNTFAGNMHPAELSGQSETNRWAAGGKGNHWQDADAIDLNGDGIGDLPHREADVLGNLRRPFPLASLLSGSPAIELLRFSRRHVPLRDAQAITDPAPLLSTSLQP